MSDTNITALVKGNERYIYVYRDDQRADVLRAFGRHATNPELSFSWMDACVMSQRVRETLEVCKGK